MKYLHYVAVLCACILAVSSVAARNTGPLTVPTTLVTHHRHQHKTITSGNATFDMPARSPTMEITEAVAATACPPLTTFYVSTTGSDSNCGGQTAPFKTIQKAANVARAGNTVLILPGTYSTPQVNLNFSGSPGFPIIFKASNPTNRPILDGTGTCGTIDSVWNNGFRGDNIQYITFDGLEIKNYCVNGIKFTGGLTQNITVNNCNIHHNGKSPLPLYGPGATDVLLPQGLDFESYDTALMKSISVTNNIVSDNLPPGNPNDPNYVGGSGITLYRTSDSSVGNNRIERNNGNGILSEDSVRITLDKNIIRFNKGNANFWGMAGIWIDGGNTVTARNTWCEGNQWAGIELSDEEQANPYGYQLYNNVILSNWIGIMLTGVGSSKTTDAYVDIYNNTLINNGLATGDNPSPNPLPGESTPGPTWGGIDIYNRWDPTSFKLQRTRIYNNIIDQRSVQTYAPAFILDKMAFSDVPINYNVYNPTGAIFQYNDTSGASYGSYRYTFIQFKAKFPSYGWTNSKNAAPSYFNPSFHDYHLAPLNSTNPSYNAGSSLFKPATDYDGHTRASTDPVDIGAFEGSGPCSTTACPYP